MKILAITPYAVYPPIGGGKLRVYNLAQEWLRLGHQVSIWMIPSDEPNPEWSEGALRPELVALPAKARSTLASKLSAVLSPQPEEVWTRSRFAGSVEMGWKNRFDCVVLMQAHVGSYAPTFRRAGIPIVLDQQNVESDVARQTARLAPTILGRLRARLDILKWRSYEPRLLRTVQATVAVSEEDATAFRKDAPGAHVLVHPNGVDPRAFEFVDHRLNRADHLLMTGTLGYLPNLDAAMWMIRDILPRVCRVRPSIRLTLVGAEPPPSLQAMKGDSVDIIGRVADMRPYLRAADLFVAPLRAGGGTRLKLLEAFAVGLPTVATTKAATGIDLRPGDHAAIADDAEALSGEILRLLDDRDARQAMAASARQLIEDRYDWRLIAVSYERDLLDVVKRVSRTDG